MISPDYIKTTVQQLISSNEQLYPYTIAVYLFGSVVKEKLHEKSDVDLAFMFNRVFYRKDSFGAVQAAEMLSVKLSDKIKKPVDVVVINGVSLRFAYHIMHKGVCIYQRTLSERILYEVLIDNEYQDFAPFIKELREIKRRVLVGRDYGKNGSSIAAGTSASKFLRYIV